MQEEDWVYSQPHIYCTTNLRNTALDEEQTPCNPITNTTISIDVHVDDALSQKQSLSSSSSPPIQFDVSKVTPFIAIAPAPPLLTLIIIQ
jgi:hypothetical protein